MPTYEYRCDDCGYEFEEFQSIKANSLRKCPECGKNGLKRLLGTGAGIIFKGSGFYQTDYRSESYQKAAKKEKESKSSTKSESKKTKTESSQKDKCKTCPKKKK
ncbi:MAG: FmdB family zinc ribbon protein [Planctomycetota bacterium]|jgi:putative FmdB family regulatory protein